MISYDNEIKDRIKDWNDNNIHILTDFDRTLTTGNSESSWEILSGGFFLPKEYDIKRDKLFKKYHPIELNESLDFETRNKYMIEWWDKHIKLLVEYKLSEDIIINAAKDIKVLKFRKGAKEWLKSLYERNIPVIIMSAGIGNFIEQFLINHKCYYSNIHIISNFIKFENGIAVGISEDMIHSLNKREDLLPDNIKAEIKDRPNTILMGDQIGDTTMVHYKRKNNVIKIGFCEANVDENLKYFMKKYDVVCTDKTDFLELRNEFKQL